MTQEYEQKWVFTEQNDLVDIKFEPYESLAGGIMFTLVFVSGGP